MVFGPSFRVHLVHKVSESDYESQYDPSRTVPEMYVGERSWLMFV